MSLIWVSRVEVLIMIRLLPERPQSSSWVATGQLLGIFKASSGLLWGCSEAFLAPLAWPPRMLLMSVIHGPPLGGARPEIPGCNCCVSMSSFGPAWAAMFRCPGDSRSRLFIPWMKLFLCIFRINEDRMVL